MPLQYPGNSISKEARAKAGGGFESAIEVDSPAQALPGSILRDSFESGNFDSLTGDGSPSWLMGESPGVSIVTSDQYVVANGNGVIDPPTGPISGREWEGSPASGGSKAARFRFMAGSESWSELTFSLGASVLSGFWLGFDLKVPINFYHSDRNNKLFRMWQESYGSVTGSKVGMEFDADGAGGSRWYAMANDGTTASLGPSTDKLPFISYPDDQGRWMRIIAHVEAETSPGAGDGVFEVWRAWIDASGNIGELVKHFDETALPIKINDGTGPAGFAEGYLLGYANSGYAEDTEFLMDNVVIGVEAMI